ncbi:MAG TPA: extracellular solute-binding protein [Amnibacterium sp.]|jgi:multiple sugar transport system substrate-binding protein|nr:extracellular solute-binding protein [Amnibacterium sp.]
MNRKSGLTILAGVATAALSSVLLVGCSSAGGSTGPADTKAPVKLTWWTGQSDAPEAMLIKLAKEFHKDHPNVTIDVSSGAPTTDDLLQKITAGFASNQYPDISYAYGSWTGALASSGRMQDITHLVAQPSVHWDQFPASGRETASPGGKTIGFPSVIDNLTLIYNKKIFDAAHVAYPTNDWTWDQFRAVAKQLTDKSKQIYGTAYPVDGSEDTTWRFWPLLWQHGGQILSADGTKSAFDSPAGVASLTFLQQMAVTDKSVYLDQTDQKYENLFTSGRIAMIPDGPWLMSNLKDAHTDYGVTFLPGTNGNHTTVSGPDIWALFDHKDANRSYWSYQLVKWLTDPAQDARYNLALGNLPMRPAAEQNLPEYKAFLKQYPGVDVMIANFANVKYARPTSSGYPGLSTAIGKAIAGVLQGQGDAASALKQAAPAADSALAKG